MCAIVTHVDGKLYSVVRGGGITCTETGGGTSSEIMLKAGVLFDAGHYSGCENTLLMFGDAKMKVYHFTLNYCLVFFLFVSKSCQCAF